jgi:hypothetical protein
MHLYFSGMFSTRGGRALTRLSRQADGSLHAEISVGRFDDDVELIAHEIEHVIEQLDEIDLSSLAALPGTGVHRTSLTDEIFETSRAAQTGVRVAREVRETRKTD